ncbi:MAG: hypothetical protein ACYS0D_11945 [Planctomycetota bacterium]|jgi:hypothetical protein
MKKLHAGIGLFIAGLFVLTLGAQDTPAMRKNPAVVVGTFDSRAIAVAYVRSDAFDEYLRAQKADIMRALERAKAAGDDELFADLEELGPAMQQRMHYQGFGTAPVDAIIARIEDRLPDIAEEAGVDVIVSKWALTYRNKDAKLVDVTSLLAAEFDPGEETLKTIRQLMKTEPVPLAQLTDHDH